MHSLSDAAWGQCFYVTSQKLLEPVRFCAQAHCLVRRKKTEHIAVSSIYQYSSLQLDEVLNHAALMCTLHSHISLTVRTYFSIPLRIHSPGWLNNRLSTKTRPFNCHSLRVQEGLPVRSSSGELYSSTTWISVFFCC